MQFESAAATDGLPFECHRQWYRLLEIAAASHAKAGDDEDEAAGTLVKVGTAASSDSASDEWHSPLSPLRDLQHLARESCHIDASKLAQCPTVTRHGLCPLCRASVGCLYALGHWIRSRFWKSANSCQRRLHPFTRLISRMAADAPTLATAPSDPTGTSAADPTALASRKRKSRNSGGDTHAAAAKRSKPRDARKGRSSRPSARDPKSSLPTPPQPSPAAPATRRSASSAPLVPQQTPLAPTGGAKTGTTPTPTGGAETGTTPTPTGGAVRAQQARTKKTTVGGVTGEYAESSADELDAPEAAVAEYITRPSFNPVRAKT
ncbi:hypothetical protein BCR44DRAFT_248797 [Catenaria anguillulae PL171]|uniref:Uncharacterized protein n=1 Tax=Catenaria anguillulae PL171 TaxID=765915 RepID=A0A1Y2HFG9_9FUNG|nr:hypothetical protein BCR44DRAFT_248797 [Catenaria anguillulae PL171]